MCVCQMVFGLLSISFFFRVGAVASAALCFCFQLFLFEFLSLFAAFFYVNKCENHIDTHTHIKYSMKMKNNNGRTQKDVE